MIITMIVTHCTDSTQCLHPLPLKFYLLFWHYSAMLEHTYYSQNYASIIGQGLVAIEQEKIEFLRDLHLSWEKIASLFGVCRKTLYNIRSSYGMIESNDIFNFTTISDEQLCEKAMKIKHDMPEIGYNMLRGVLRAQGIHVSISRVQQCLSQIDPVNTALRWATPQKAVHCSLSKFHMAS